jgi:transposase
MARSYHIDQRTKDHLLLAYGRTESIALSARAAGVGYNTAKRWLGRIKTKMGLAPRRGGGRPRLLDRAAEDQAKKLLLNHDMDGAAHVAMELHKQGIDTPHVSRQTIMRAARRAAQRQGTPLKVWHGRPLKLLSEATKGKRLRFALAHQHTNWDTTVFTDRKRFSFRYPGSRVKQAWWLLKGQTVEVKKSPHPLSFNVYCGLTKYGTTRVHPVTGTSKQASRYTTKTGKPARNITAAEYKVVMQQTLLPDAHAIFTRHGVTFWVFMQDNDPTHKGASAIIKQWAQGQSSAPELLANWPAHSPDLNPIENVWAWAQAQVDKAACSTFEEFMQEVIDTLKRVPKAMCEKLVSSMSRRLQAVIRAEGGRTKY